MLKYVPLVLLTGVPAVIVAAPKAAPKEGVSSHAAVAQLFATTRAPGLRGNPHIGTTLTLRYALNGKPGEKYTVDLYVMPRKGNPQEPIHLDTAEVAVPATGKGLQEVNARFDRWSFDRKTFEKDDKPGLAQVPAPEIGKGWQYRLVVRQGGRVVSDTGFSWTKWDPTVLA